MTLYPTVSTAPLPRSADRNGALFALATVCRAQHQPASRRARITSRTGLFEEVNIMNDVPANGSKVVR
jgi:hypothetical protein